MPPTEDVIVVGGGAAGLSAAAALVRKGIDPLVLDKGDRVGGAWTRRYDRLHLHTVRRFSGLAHHPMPRTYPRFVSKDVYAEYLEQYARTAGLRLELNRHVRAVRPLDGWEVETDDGERRSARAVVIATGRYSEPVVPSWPGTERYSGRIVHSHGYGSGREFAGRAVLVVGIGNSGAEIAADLAEQDAARVAIAVRTPPPIMPRQLFGVLPVQYLGMALTPLPAPKLLDRVGAVTRRLANGDLTRYGLGKEEWGPFTARRPPVIDVGFLRQLKAGRIEVRPAVESFTPTGVRFAGGAEEDFDAVVAATGFATRLEGLLEVPDALRADGRPLARSGRPTPFPGLYFIGFDETMRGVLFEANRDSRRLATAVERYLATPRARSGTSSA
jgi:cation diffusion facilitator CzcD-associated flavoprotein CzcO